MLINADRLTSLSQNDHFSLKNDPKRPLLLLGHRDFGQNDLKMVRNGKLSLKIRVLPLLDKAGKPNLGFSNRKKSEIGPFPIVSEPGFWGLKLTFDL